MDDTEIIEKIKRRLGKDNDHGVEILEIGEVEGGAFFRVSYQVTDARRPVTTKKCVAYFAVLRIPD